MHGDDGTGPAGHFLVSPRYLAAFQPKQVPHFFTDILVIGSGLAGLAGCARGGPEAVGSGRHEGRDSVFQQRSRPGRSGRCFGRG